MLRVRLATCFLLLATPAIAQQAGSIDLSGPAGPDQTASKLFSIELPDSCRELTGGGVSDGVVVGREPQKITVRIIGISNHKPLLNSEVEARLRLQNTGNDSIQIPWSTDPKIMRSGQDATHLQFESGSFEVLLNGYGFLPNVSKTLYGSSFAPGSQLIIRSGEWIDASIKFKMAGTSTINLSARKAALSIKWVQANHSLEIDNCQQWSGFYSYGYQERTPSVKIEVKEGIGQ